jgi:nicotinate-nucleotide pyrophosphorylase (carboxylating)
MTDLPFSPAVDALIDLALTEDLGAGDLTSDILFPGQETARGSVLAKEPLVVAGLGVFARVLARVDPDVSCQAVARDGQSVAAGGVIARVSGRARSLLRGERTALNFLRRLSGVATLTARYVEALGPDGPRLCDTRKTTPGLRELEKYAVRMGGGFNHRFNLGAGALVKDNHIAALGSIAEAVRRLRAHLPHTATIEVEVTSPGQVDEALTAGADIVLLDNMSDAAMAEAVARCRGRAVTEASGRITLERLAALRQVGVDVVSSGALTHSAPAADISLDLEIGSSP